MDQLLYKNLTKYAATMLSRKPKDRILSAQDLVAQAYIEVGKSDHDALKKSIRRQVYDRGDIPMLDISMADSQVRRSALCDSRIKTCVKCGVEKDLSDFKKYRKTKTGPADYCYSSKCRRCINSEQWASIKNDPDKHAAHLERKRKSNGVLVKVSKPRVLDNPEKEEQRKKLSSQKREVRRKLQFERDPLAKQIWLAKERVRRKKKYDRIKNDPQQVEKLRERGRNKSKRFAAKQRELFAQHPELKAELIDKRRAKQVEKFIASLNINQQKAMTIKTKNMVDEYQVETMLVTPDIAKEWLLLYNTENRQLSMPHVQFLIKQMKSGDWEDAGDPIRFSVTNRLLDGQHRLSAIVYSDIPQKMLVIRGLPDTTFVVMDTGKLRSAADVLHTHGIVDSHYAASTVRLILAYKRTGLNKTSLGNQARSTAGSSSNAEILEFIQRNDLSEYVRQSRTWNKECRFLGSPDYAFLYYTLAKLDKAEAYTFLSSFVKGANLDEEDPRFVLRKRFEQWKLNGVASKPTERLGMCIKAWNAWRKGESRRIISFNPDKDTFPIPA